MIKTVPLDIPVNFLIGSVITCSAARQILRGETDPFGRFFWTAVLYSAYFGLVVAYFYFRHPDWMHAYFFDTSILPVMPGYLLFFSTLVVAGGCGSVVSHAFIVRGRTWLAIAVAGYGLLLWVIVFLLTRDQYLHIGTYAQYQAGTAPHMQDVPSFRLPFMFAGPLMILPLVVIIVRYILEGRRAPPDDAAKRSD